MSLSSIQAANAYVGVNLDRRKADSALSSMLADWRRKITQSFQPRSSTVWRLPTGMSEWGSRRSIGALSGLQGMYLPGSSRFGGGGGNSILGGGLRVASGIGIAGGIGGITDSFRSVLKYSRDYEETLNKFKLSFRELSDETLRWAETTSKATNRATVSFVGFASQFQNFFTGFGFALTQSAKMSKALSQLAFDLGSFHNVPDDESARRLFQGLAGSTEALDVFGINAREARVRQELNRSGIPNYDKATGEQKVLARYNVIVESTRNAQGDAARTADSFANSLRGLESGVKQAAIATGLLFTRSEDLAKATGKQAGIFFKLIPAMRDVSFGLAKYVEEHEGAIRESLTFVANIATLVTSLYAMNKALNISVGLFTALRGVMAVAGGSTAAIGIRSLQPLTSAFASASRRGRVVSRFRSIRRSRRNNRGGGDYDFSDSTLEDMSSSLKRQEELFRGGVPAIGVYDKALSGLGVTSVVVGQSLLGLGSIAVGLVASMGLFAASILSVANVFGVLASVLAAPVLLGLADHLIHAAFASKDLSSGIDGLINRFKAFGQNATEVGGSIRAFLSEAIADAAKFAADGDLDKAWESVGVSIAEAILKGMQALREGIPKLLREVVGDSGAIGFDALFNFFERTTEGLQANDQQVADDRFDGALKFKQHAEERYNIQKKRLENLESQTQAGDKFAESNLPRYYEKVKKSLEELTAAREELGKAAENRDLVEQVGGAQATKEVAVNARVQASKDRLKAAEDEFNRQRNAKHDAEMDASRKGGPSDAEVTKAHKLLVFQRESHELVMKDQQAIMKDRPVGKKVDAEAKRSEALAAIDKKRADLKEELKIIETQKFFEDVAGSSVAGLGKVDIPLGDQEFDGKSPEGFQRRTFAQWRVQRGRRILSDFTGGAFKLGGAIAGIREDTLNERKKAGLVEGEDLPTSATFAKFMADWVIKPISGVIPDVKRQTLNDLERLSYKALGLSDTRIKGVEQFRTNKAAGEEFIKNLGRGIGNFINFAGGNFGDISENAAKDFENKAKKKEKEEFQTAISSFGSFSAREAMFGSVSTMDPTLQVQSQTRDEIKRVRELIERRRTVIL